MATSFRTQVKKALANPSLQAALDGNHERRWNARISAYASLPENLATMRQRAHTIRMEVIDNLDLYVDLFVQRATANGMIVHRATNGAQAAEIILEIAQANHTRLVAKSKTMVGEEIEINQALEAAGIEVVETDLGEYIVQIRGERPAHIITPAVHLRRGEVGQTFHEKLGIPYTDDIPTLTSAARDKLRQVFLQADLGISGVNLGVAEEGLLCLLTNEGNGRLVTTLPRVHIALMGIERLVPTLDDLAAILYLLPRSATGQKLTVYGNLIRSPRGPGDPDGPEQRHLVLLDNGRSSIRNSNLKEMLYCVRCGACLNACPVFRELGGHSYVGVTGQPTPYPGPIGSCLSPALFDYATFGHLAHACSLCGACKEACPVETDLPDLLLRLRAGQTVGGQKPPNAPVVLKAGLGAFTWFATSRTRFRLAQRLAGIFGRLAAPRKPWLRLPAFTGWGMAKDFPRPAARPFSDRWPDPKSSLPVSPVNASDPSTFQAPRKRRDPDSSVPPVPTDRSPAREDTDPKTKLVTAPRIERFAAGFAALGGNFISCTPDRLSDMLLAWLWEEGIRTIQAWDECQFPQGLQQALEAGGIRLTQDLDPSLSTGLTGAVAGVAETGTLVLTGGEGRPLTASLLPRTHLAVLPATKIYDRLTQVLCLPEVRQAASTVLISGPSRTADIEMTLTVGMHGPGRLYVFCILDGQ